MDGADIRKKETNAYADFLRRVMSTGPPSKISPPPQPSPEKMSRGHADGRNVGVIYHFPTTDNSFDFFKELKYEPPKQERVDEDDDEDEDDYDEDDNFVENQARAYDRVKFGPVLSSYIMPYVYKRRFLGTNYGVRKDSDMYIIGDSPIVVETGGDITLGKE